MPGAPGQQDKDSLAGWLPYRLEWTDDEPQVRWLRLNSPGFDDSPPKFRRAVAELRAAGAEERVTPISAISAISADGAAIDGLTPTGFVFHMTRCGSTFVSNVLAGLSDTVVIKEADPIDSCLRADVTAPDDRRSAWLVDLVAALGQRFAGHERRYYIKFRSWNVLRHELIRACFPDVPCVFLYRDPLEVLVSLIQAEPPWDFEVVPGLRKADQSRVDYYARVIAAFLDRGLELAAAGVPVINYAELGSDRLLQVLAGLGAPATPELRASVDAQRQVHSKDPRRRFVPDTEDKRRAASAKMRAAVDRVARAGYDQLEALRTGA